MKYDAKVKSEIQEKGWKTRAEIPQEEQKRKGEFQKESTEKGRGEEHSKRIQEHSQAARLKYP